MAGICTGDSCGGCVGCLISAAQIVCTSKFTITERTSTTIYSVDNGTILGVTNLTSPIPTNYSAAEFFEVLDYAFWANTTTTSEPLYGYSVNSSFFETFIDYAPEEYNGTVAQNLEYCWSIQGTQGTFLTPYFQIIELALIEFNLANPRYSQIQFYFPSDIAFPTAFMANSYSRVQAH